MLCTKQCKDDDPIDGIGQLVRNEMVALPSRIARAHMEMFLEEFRMNPLGVLFPFTPPQVLRMWFPWFPLKGTHTA